MGADSRTNQILRQNLAALEQASPEVSRWLADFLVEAPPDPATLPGTDLSPERAAPGAISVLVGGVELPELAGFLGRVPPGHQVFWLEPRGELLKGFLARHDLTMLLDSEDLVLLAPGEAELEEALNQHPQLGLADRVRVLALCLGDDSACPTALDRVYRVLGRAAAARDHALTWENHTTANLLANLEQAAWMGATGELPGSLYGRPAVIADAGPSLSDFLETMAGRLAGVALFCTDRALAEVLAAGVEPTAVGITAPGPCHPEGMEEPVCGRLPLVAEELASAEVVRDWPGPRLVCLGPRGTGFGPLAGLSGLFTPQQHAISRLAEVAGVCGADPVFLVGCELCSDSPGLGMTAMDGSSVLSSLAEAGCASALGQVLTRRGTRAYSTSPKGLGLPGALLADPARTLAPHAAPGQPLVLEPLMTQRWLEPEELAAFGEDLRVSAARATRLWQRAAAPAADQPAAADEAARRWLLAADALFVALAEQSAADPLMSAVLDGCLIRAFRRRHALVTKSRATRVSLEEACQQLGLCLGEMAAKANELAAGLWRLAEDFKVLARARRRGERQVLAAYAVRAGRA